SGSTVRWSIPRSTMNASFSMPKPGDGAATGAACSPLRGAAKRNERKKNEIRSNFHPATAFLSRLARARTRSRIQELRRTLALVRAGPEWVLAEHLGLLRHPFPDETRDGAGRRAHARRALVPGGDAQLRAAGFATRRGRARSRPAGHRQS